jgi:hypothetical protein
MPREREKPRRGSSWYTLDARQKRQQRLERAFSMDRTQIAHRERMAWSPPMAYVEEVILDEPIQIPLEPLLFTVPENWQPPSNLPEEAIKAVNAEHQDHNTMEEQLEEFHICYVEEEFQEDLLHMASQDVALTAGYNVSRATESNKDQGKPAGDQGQSVAIEQQSGVETSEAKASDISKEGDEVLVPPPISIMQEQWHVPPPFFHPEHL